MLPVKSKRATRLIVFFGVIVLISVVSLVAINAAFSVTNEIYNGVKVGDIDVGGLSIKEAETKIEANFKEKIKQPAITIIHENQHWSISAEDIRLVINPADLAAKAYDIGRTGSIFSQLKDKYLTINRGNMVAFNSSYDRNKIETIVRDIARKIDREPQNAGLTYAKSAVMVSPDSVGYKVDVEKTVSAIIEKLDTTFPVTLILIINEVPPTVKANDLEEINSLISSYSTQFNAWDENRTQNIIIAAKNVNGVLVKNGESFSFNKYVGPRLAQYGYKIAPVFINGKLLPDWGGGVCQVSSTLYNAVLLADLVIEERTPHIQPPGYVPLGQDATVADNQLDFRFKNTSGHNIYITTEISGNQLTVSIFGKANPALPEIQVISAGRKVLEPNTIVKQDSQLELGKEVVEVEGHKGFQVSTYRVKYLAGKEIGREFIAADDFPPEDRVVRVGTKTPAPQKNK